MTDAHVRRADLHMHSTSSDGVLHPRELVDACFSADLQVISITDHDTFSGTDSLRSDALPLTLIPGIELSMRDMPGLHLLGYGLSDAPSLRKQVTVLRTARVDRAREMVQKLSQLDCPLDWDMLLEGVGDSIGRPHIARAMLRAGYVSSMQEAFDAYLGHDAPAYVPARRLSMAEALPLMRENGFVPVLAHPRELKLPEHLLQPLLRRWMDMGLMGMQVYHPSGRTGSGFAALDRMARTLGLLVTGGSDYHQPHDKHDALGSTCAEWAACADDLAQLLDALDRASAMNP